MSSDKKRVHRRSRAESASMSPIVGFCAALPPILIIIAFVGIPVILSIGFSLGITGGLNSTIADIGSHVHTAHSFVTFEAYEDLFGDKRFIRDLISTIVVTICATSGTIIVSLIIASVVRLRGGTIGTILFGLGVIPLFIPVVIASWAILSFYSGDGFLRSILAHVGINGPVMSYTSAGIIIASIWVNLPFSILMNVSGMQSIPDALIEAARDAGARTHTIVFKILIPMSSVPIIIATTFTAIGVLGQFTVPYFMGPNAPQQLGVDIAKYFQSFNQPQQAAGIAVIVFILASGAAAIYVWENFRDASKDLAQ